MYKYMNFAGIIHITRIYPENVDNYRKRCKYYTVQYVELVESNAPEVFADFITQVATDPPVYECTFRTSTHNSNMLEEALQGCQRILQIQVMIDKTAEMPRMCGYDGLTKDAPIETVREYQMKYNF